MHIILKMLFTVSIEDTMRHMMISTKHIHISTCTNETTRAHGYMYSPILQEEYLHQPPVLAGKLWVTMHSGTLMLRRMNSILVMYRKKDKGCAKDERAHS